MECRRRFWHIIETLENGNKRRKKKLLPRITCNSYIVKRLKRDDLKYR